MNEETARAGIRVQEAEKAHNIRTFSQGRGAKKKDPNCIQIRVLLWCRKWDTPLHPLTACPWLRSRAGLSLPGPGKASTGCFADPGFESHSNKMQ